MTKLSTMYEDEVNGRSVELYTFLNEAKNWKNGARVYYEMYQSDHNTRVAYFYKVLKTKPSRNDVVLNIESRDGTATIFGFRLCDKGYRQNLNIIGAVSRLAEEIAKVH